MNQTVTYAATHAATRQVAASPIVPRADRTTRQLVIAAHLDPKFAACVIKEYLTEPRRCLPSSAGVNAAAVVYEAVAAHTRRRIRDWILVGLMVLLLLTSWIAIILWFGAAVIRLLKFVKLPSSLSSLGAPLPVLAVLLPVVILLYPVLLVGGFLTAITEGAGLLIIPAIFAVLLADRLVEWWLVTRSFPTYGTSRSWPYEAQIRTLGVKRFGAQIDAVVQHAMEGNVLVFRGERPFVGAGEPFLSKSFAIPLVPAEGEDSDGKTCRTPAATSGSPGSFRPTCTATFTMSS
jgi:hypothetical protein